MKNKSRDIVTRQYVRQFPNEFARESLLQLRFVLHTCPPLLSAQSCSGVSAMRLLRSLVLALSVLTSHTLAQDASDTPRVKQEYQVCISQSSCAQS